MPFTTGHLFLVVPQRRTPAQSCPVPAQGHLCQGALRLSTREFHFRPARKTQRREHWLQM